MMCFLQIASVAAWEDAADEDQEGVQPSDAASSAAAASLAQQILLQLATDPAHGLAPLSDKDLAGEQLTLLSRAIPNATLC
jgi:hypothetical protein